MDSVKYKWRSVNLDDFGTAGPNTNFEGLLGIEECLDYSVLSKRNARRKAQKEKKTETAKRKAPSSADGNVTPKKSKIISSSGFEVDSVIADVSLTPLKGPNTPDGKKKEKKNKNKPKTNGIEVKDSVVVPNDSEIPEEDAATRKKNKQKQKKAEKKAAKKAEATNGVETKEGEKKENTPVKKKKKRKPTKFERERAKRDQRRADKKKDKAMKDKPVNEDEAVVKPPEISSLNAIPVEDMQAWMQFSIPDVILRALADQGFRTPTQIQELTLPAALHGRRDILGAAETGSGKTLAFGIPILTGILRMKEDLANGIQEKTLNALPNALINPFVSEQAKIVNFNKLNKEEKKKLMKEIKSKKKYKSRKRVQRDDDENEDDEEDGEVSEEEDSDEDEADISSDDDEASESDENGEMVVDDEISEQSDEESVDGDMDMLESDGDDDDEDLGIGSDEGSNQTPDEDEIIHDDEMEPAINDDDDDEESDFEEREEEVEGLNEEGIGCVKVIDNVSPSEIIPEVPGKKKRPLKPLYALILTPTRELAIQVKNHLVAAAKYMDILIAVVVGGMAEVKQERVLKHCPEIVVATPGRLWQMIQQGNRHLSQVTDIRYLAIDETDRMMERGHFEELHHLLDKVNDDEQRKARRQTFVFSATLTMVHDLPHHLKGKKVTKKGKVISKKVDKLTAEQKLKKVIEMLGITDPKVVDVTVGNQGSSDTLTECRIICPIDHKDFYLYYVLKRYPGRTIVFCNSIGCVKRLAQLFGLLACNPLPIHASMQQRQRLKNLDKFRDSPHGLLIATDVAARGLDIPNVEHVIHYQVPRTAENYVHRSGRTARASKEGIAILIMEPTEVQNYTKMCKTLAKTEDLPHFPVDGALLAAVRLRVDLARELDLLTLKVRKDSAQRGWLEKAALDMDMVIDDTDMPHKMENQAAADLKNVLVIKKKQLTQLLNSPLFPKGFSFKFPTNNMLENTLSMPQKQNAVQAMKSAMDSGLVKKLKKATKNEAMLNLPADLKNMISHSSNETLKENNAAIAALDKDAAILNNGEKVSKNKWKKLKRTVAT